MKKTTNKNKPSKKKINKALTKESNTTVENILKNWIESLIEKYQTIYETMPKELVRDQEELIKRISAYSPEKCLALIHASIGAIETLRSKDPLEEIKSEFYKDWSVVWDWKVLLHLARTRDYNTLQGYAKSYGITPLLSGYWLMYILAQKRLEMYTDENPNERAAVYLYPENAKILEELGYLQELDNSLERLLPLMVFRKAKTNWEGLTDDEKLELELIYKCLHVSINKALKGVPIEEQIMKATKGDEKLKYLPHDIFCDEKKALTKELKKQRSTEKIERSLDSPIIEGSDLTLNDQQESEFNPEELIETLDNHKIIAQAVSLLSNPAIFTDRERQVLSMRYPLDGEGVTTLEKTGQELGITKQTAHEIEKTALRKLFSLLRHFNPY